MDKTIRRTPDGKPERRTPDEMLRDAVSDDTDIPGKGKPLDLKAYFRPDAERRENTYKSISPSCPNARTTGNRVSKPSSGLNNHPSGTAFLDPLNHLFSSCTHLTGRHRRTALHFIGIYLRPSVDTTSFLS